MFLIIYFTKTLGLTGILVLVAIFTFNKIFQHSYLEVLP